MTMSTRIQENIFKGIVILALFTGLTLRSCTVDAQSLKPIRYKGLSANFGVRSFSLISDIKELNNMKVTEEGGNIGVVFGNELLRARVQVAGFYYSSANVCRTVNLFETAGVLTLYPLQFGRTKKLNVEPYLTAGGGYNSIRFFGFYLDKDKPHNYSGEKEPYLGSVNQVMATVGAGLTWKIINEPNFNFAHLNAEVRYATPLSQGSASEAFRNTTTKEHLAVSVGIAFGMYK